jgi:UDP:flavonoid glycosyltransferase YjiC (YdhE family)
MAMRVLFTSTPIYSHFRPLVPFARALADAGHEVAVAAPAPLAGAVAGAGFRHIPAGLDRELAELFPQLRPAGEAAAPPAPDRPVFADLWPRHLVPDLLALAALWPPGLRQKSATNWWKGTHSGSVAALAAA